MENSQQKKIYRLADIAGEVDRDKTTLLRWEADGKIPPGRRDSRGWRYYTPEDFELVVRLIKSHLYSPNQANGRARETAAASIPAAAPVTPSFRETSSSGWFRRLFSLLFTLFIMVAISWFSARALSVVPVEVEKQITAVINTFRLPEASLSFSSLPSPRPSSAPLHLRPKAEKKSRPSKVKPNEQRKASSSRKLSPGRPGLKEQSSTPPSLILPRESQIDFNPHILKHLQTILRDNRLAELARLPELDIDLESLDSFFETDFNLSAPPPITIASLKEKLRRGADSLPQTASLLDQAKGLWANVSRTLQLDLLGELKQETRPEEQPSQPSESKPAPAVPPSSAVSAVSEASPSPAAKQLQEQPAAVEAVSPLPRVSSATGSSGLQQRLDALETTFNTRISKLITDVATLFTSLDSKAGLSSTLVNRINSLQNVTFSGSNTFNLTDADVPDTIAVSGYLGLGGGTLTGTLGIGTTTPGTKLAVHAASTLLGGETTIYGPLTLYYLNATGTTASTFINASTTDSFSVGNLLTVSGAGTSTFSGGLSAAGLASSNGLRISTGDSIFAGGLQVTGTINITNTTQASTFPIASTTSFSAANLITVAGAGTSTFTGGVSTGGLTVSNGLTVTSGSLDVSGVGIKATNASTTNLSISNLLTVSGAGTSTFTGGLSTAGLASSNGLRVSAGDSIFAGGIQVAGGSNFTGSLGIGTSSPASLLSINGPFLAQSTSTINGAGLIAQALFSTTSLNFYTASNVSPRLTIDSSGNVGIGTTSPGAALAVNGPAIFVGTSTIFGGLNLESISATGTLGFYTRGTAAPRLLIDSSGFLGVGTTSPWGFASIEHITSSNPAFPAFVVSDQGTSTPSLVVLNQNGWVGIATRTPGAVLAINGSALFGATTTFLGGLNVRESGTSTFAGHISSTDNIRVGGTLEIIGGCKGCPTGSPGGSSSQFQYNSSGAFAGASNLIYDSSTNFVGIATATPGSLLSINGPFLAQSTSTINGAGLIAQALFSTSSLNFYTNSNPTPRLTIDSSGNVGIGTTSPGAALAVSGLSLFTGTSTMFGGTIVGTGLSAGQAAPRVPGLNADFLDGSDSSAFGDATVGNQTTIINAIGLATDATTTYPQAPASLFAGIKGAMEQSSFGGVGYPGLGFGDGSDGARTVSSNTTDAAGTIISQYTTLVINASTILTINSANNYRIILATQSITINGEINVDGRGGAGGAGGTGTGGTQGGDGGSVSGTAVAWNAAGAGGGGGGTGASTRSGGGAGGAGGAEGSPASVGTATSALKLARARLLFGLGGLSGGPTIHPSLWTLLNSFGGGGGGGNVSVAGGAGGGTLLLAAPTITIAAAGVVGARGAAGTADGVNGGGGGGGGGVVILIYRTLANSGSVLVTGGTGGDGIGVADGGAGADGLTVQIPVK